MGGGHVVGLTSSTIRCLSDNTVRIVGGCSCCRRGRCGCVMCGANICVGV